MPRSSKREKKDAVFSYKGYKAYQPLNTYWAELGLILHTEFRDGNVPAGHEQLRVFTHALSLLPEEIKTVRLRSDTAGYQHDLLTYCDDEKAHPRLGKIEFAIGADVTREFKKAVRETQEWHPLHDDKGRITGEWAEVCFVPNAEVSYEEGAALPLSRNTGTDETTPSSYGRPSFPDHRLR